MAVLNLPVAVAGHYIYSYHGAQTKVRLIIDLSNFPS